MLLGPSHPRAPRGVLASGATRQSWSWGWGWYRWGRAADGNPQALGTVHAHLSSPSSGHRPRALSPPQVAWLGTQRLPKTKREGCMQGADPPPAWPGGEATRPTPFGKGHRTPTAVLNASGQRWSRRGPAGRAAAGSHARDKENHGAGETSSERHRRLSPPRDPGTHPPCTTCKCQAASPQLCRAGCWRCREAALPAPEAGEAASCPRDGQKAGKTWPPHLQA